MGTKSQMHSGSVMSCAMQELFRSFSFFFLRLRGVWLPVLGYESRKRKFRCEDGWLDRVLGRSRA